MNHDAALEIRDLIIEHLATGVYSVGSKLPTARELAGEVGVHRNTVAKAYRLLADLGLVASRQGRGTFVIATAQLTGQPTARASISSAAEKIARQARRLGLVEADLRALLDEQIRASYGTALPRAAFVECNLPDIHAHIEEIASVTRTRLDPLLLDEALRDRPATAATFDAIFTSLFHVKELIDAFADVAPGMPVVGLSVYPDEQALGEIAYIPAGSHVGIVAATEGGTHRFANLVRTYAAVTATTLISPAAEEIRALARTADVIICTRSRERQVRELGLAVPVIGLPFHITQQSALKVAETLTRGLGDHVVETLER